jgi:co-chaperonin GroES (HSP10)
LIEVVKLEKEAISSGRFTTHNKKSEYLDIKEGEMVYFRPNIAYEITIDGKDYLRMRPEDLLYTIQDGEV